MTDLLRYASQVQHTARKQIDVVEGENLGRTASQTGPNGKRSHDNTKMLNINKRKLFAY